MYWIKNLGPVSFALRLKMLMNRKGISQQTLADKIGVSKNTVTAWLKGTPLKRNSPKILERLSNEFDVDPEFLTCEQAEERVPHDQKEIGDVLKGNLHHSLALHGGVHNLMKALGYSVVLSNLIIPVKALRFIEDGYLYEAAVYDDGLSNESLFYSAPDSCVQIKKGNKDIAELTPSQFEEFCKKIEEYLIFQISQLEHL